MISSRSLAKWCPSLGVVDRDIFRRTAGIHFCGVEKSGHGQVELDILVALVLKKPAVNSGRRGGEGTIGGLLAEFVVKFVALKVILVRFLVRFAVKFIC